MVFSARATTTTTKGRDAADAAAAIANFFFKIFAKFSLKIEKKSEAGRSERQVARLEVGVTQRTGWRPRRLRRRGRRPAFAKKSDQFRIEIRIEVGMN